MLILFSFFCTVCVLCTHTPTHTHRDDATKDKKSLRMCGPREIHERRQRNDTLFLIYYFKGENSPLAGTPSILYRPDMSPLSKCQIELKKIKKGKKKKIFLISFILRRHSRWNGKKKLSNLFFNFFVIASSLLYFSLCGALNKSLVLRLIDCSSSHFSLFSVSIINEIQRWVTLFYIPTMMMAAFEGRFFRFLGTK